MSLTKKLLLFIIIIIFLFASFNPLSDLFLFHCVRSSSFFSPSSSHSLLSSLLSLPLLLISSHPFFFFFFFLPTSSIQISWLCSLSSPACAAVAASKAIKQWEFSTQQMCWMEGWRDGWEDGGGWRRAAQRTNLHLSVSYQNESLGKVQAEEEVMI